MTSTHFEDGEQAQRLADIFGTQNVPDVDVETLTTFAAYLNAHLDMPCAIVVAEVFDWEEPFLEPNADKAAYDRLRTEQPTHLDTYDILAVEDIPDSNNGLMADIRRHTDDRLFTVPLESLEAEQSDSKNFILLKDYLVWHILQG
ncbi:MAG TPA: hypothetical protein DIT99_04280 [Candidatus Latescibacteria bacterium]|nr:hypothetical protein [Candidatus Latescibacterota bacterium]